MRSFVGERLESSALESIREEERRLRESREYHERSQREDAEKIQSRDS